VGVVVFLECEVGVCVCVCVCKAIGIWVLSVTWSKRAIYRRYSEIKGVQGRFKSM